MQPWFRTLCDWIELPSVTGNEGAYGDALARRLSQMGLGVERQELAPGRFNVLARAGKPRVVLCTHLDTVPPFIGVREERTTIHGRGACDAKGPAIAMLAAVEKLLASGEERVGLLFTAGEETDSAGATLANTKLAEPWDPAFTIVGEPTDLRYVAAGKGTFKAKLEAKGVAGHSSQNVGPSAVHELVQCAHRLLTESWGSHPVLGPGTLNVGQIHGGVAANVVAAHAEAEIFVRTVEPVERVQARIERCLGEHVKVALHAKAYPPIEFVVPEGETGIPIAFGTDVPHLSRWGRPLLIGPGSILDAHTDHEKVEKKDLERAAVEYERAARWALARVDEK